MLIPADTDLINVHVMHADALLCAGLCAILAAQAEFELSQAAPDVIVADYDRGIAAAREPDAAPVLVVTHLGKASEVRRAVRAGVSGYVMQNATADELLLAVRRLALGSRHVCGPALCALGDSVAHSELTAREMEVLVQLAQGCTNKSAARKLGIGEQSVKSHVKALIGKLDATSRTHAVAIAAQRGLINWQQAGAVAAPR